MIFKYSLEMTDTKRPVLVEDKKFEYDGTNFVNPPKIVDMINEIFRLKFKAEEHLYLCIFDAKMNILGVFEVAHGSVNAAAVSPREVMMRALLSGAVGVVLLHNHPSLSISPSNEDKKLFFRLGKVFALFGIEFFDFIIIGDGYYSFREKNVFTTIGGFEK